MSLNAYRTLARAAVKRANVETIASAQMIDNFADALEASANIGKYVPETDSQMSEYVRKNASEIEITQEFLPSGVIVNRANVVFSNGKTIQMRIWGIEKGAESLPAHKLTADEIKKSEILTCTSDGAPVLNMQRPFFKDGKLCYPKQWYLKVA